MSQLETPVNHFVIFSYKYSQSVAKSSSWVITYEPQRRIQQIKKQGSITKFHLQNSFNSQGL